ncbi:MAG: biotin--[acetyl-CoA-carboxylase] ligase [Pseudoflavonifractor sp.]|nr:biotin--[acetyl-CoA-carboxylase] ligase [Pseudoflavonifractor sp.]
MTRPQIIKLDHATSTNTYLAGIAATAPHGMVVAASEQSAGRGQRGNSWEAQPGCNLTFSMLLRPVHIDAREQFAISEAVAVAIVEVLRQRITDIPVKVKWPNDIYVGDSKICGILIENSITGTAISYSIVGIGINVNQQRFLSDAPNPISLINVTGTETDLDELLIETSCEILSTFDSLCRRSTMPALHRRYLSMMWRGEGYHPYIETATGSPFSAMIADVSPDGTLWLVDTNGLRRSYAFKEVSYVI